MKIQKKFRKKPVIVNAYQWNGERDNPYISMKYQFGEEKYKSCKYCNKEMGSHGWINTLEGGHIVCPEDWIITGVNGEKYPCKPDIFKKTYDEV